MGFGGGVLARKLARAKGGGASADLAFAGGFDAGLASDGDAGAGFDGFAPAAPAVDPAARAWRLALARAARDQVKLTIGFSDLSLREASLAEVLETPMQRALILMLQGRGEGMGLIILSGQMLAAMIEMLTLTRLAPNGPDSDDLRKPTRTDATMAADFVDAALAGFESALADGGGDASWAAGYRFAAFIDDPRPLHLMLDDGEYHVIQSELALEEGGRSGSITLALPKLAAPAALPDFAPMEFDLGPNPDLPSDDSFTADLANLAQDLPSYLDGALAKISLPIERVMRLQVGEVLPLPLANLDQINLVGLDGRRVAGARLGQNRGMRALRLTDVALPRAPAMPDIATPQAVDHAAAPSLSAPFAAQIEPAPPLGLADAFDQGGDAMGFAAPLVPEADDPLARFA